jgi:hypothetical protein
LGKAAGGFSPRHKVGHGNLGDLVPIGIAKVRPTNLEFFLLRFGDAAVPPLCVKRISSIKPPFALGMLGAVFR